MNARGAALLINPHPCSHIVYPYTDEGLVEQAVCLFAVSGLRDGDGVILIMTGAHCEPIKLRLTLEGLDVDYYERSGQLACLKSEDLLAKFMAAGSLDEELFRSTIAGLINRSEASTTNGKPRRVRVFGEMVSQLRNSDISSRRDWRNSGMK